MEKKLRVGIIGCGTIFPMHAESVRQACKDAARLVAVCDIKQDRVFAASAKYKCTAYANYRTMIDKENLDVVHVCVPHYLHSEMAVYAAAHGVNIYMEKPMGINIQQAKDIVKAVKEKPVKMAVSFQNRFNPSTQLAKKMIASGELGNIISARLVLAWHKSDEYYLKSDWKGTADKEGGGVVIDQAIHSLDILRYLFGTQIEWIDATTANRMHVRIQVEDEAAGVIMFKDGAYVNFYTICHNSYDDDVEMEIHCEKGMIKIVKDTADVWIKDKKFGGHKRSSPKPGEFIDYGEGWKDYWGYCHSIEIKKLYNSILNNTAVDVNEDEGLETQWMIDGIYESGRTGKKVFMDEFKKAKG
ncbi:MAG: Gfo/Idh/MocA family oxidoreductase [Spirochaetia bacterium]|nr:Gfo/Idh/MocA family oxidoreductase [Spirochaetia bacterium]